MAFSFLSFRIVDFYLKEYAFYFYTPLYYSSNWEIDELIENFTFLPNEMSQIGNKTDENRLGFAVIFKFFQQEARFPITKHEIPKVVIDFIAKQTKLLQIYLILMSLIIEPILAIKLR
ncbi:MAG: DUF4158 domain-containing protein [Candidatus Eremiobacterota bacterium]